MEMYCAYQNTVKQKSVSVTQRVHRVSAYFFSGIYFCSFEVENLHKIFFSLRFVFGKLTFSVIEIQLYLFKQCNENMRQHLNSFVQ